MGCSGGLWGILSGLTKSTDHPSTGLEIPDFGAAARALVRSLQVGSLQPGLRQNSDPFRETEGSAPQSWRPRGQKQLRKHECESYLRC